MNDVKKVNEDDLVECRICGVKKGQLFKHIQASHKMTFAQYKELFPGAQNLNKASRLVLSKQRIANNPMSNPESVERIRQTRKKNKVQWIQALKDSYSSGGRVLPHNNFHHCRGGVKEDLGHYVRSSWESNFCRILKHFGVPYEYEKQRVSITDEEGKLVWIPDLYIPEMKLLVEIKGQRDKRWGRVEKFLLSEGTKFLVLSYKEMFEMKNLYSFDIPNWESTSILRKRKLDPFGPKAKCKSSYMLEKPNIQEYLRNLLGKNLNEAKANQQGSLESQTPQRLHAGPSTVGGDDIVRSPKRLGANTNGVFFEAVGFAQLITVASSEIQVTGKFTPNDTLN